MLAGKHIAAFLASALLASSDAFVVPRSDRSLYVELRSSSESTIERLDNSAVSITIPVPGSATQASFDKVCRELSKSANIPGFRKGAKIPAAVLQQAIAAKGGPLALETQAIHELVASLVEPALRSHNVEPIGQPSLAVPAEEMAASFKAGEDITLHINCDVWPELEWKGDRPYVGLNGEYSRPPFNQEKLDQAVSDLKERYASLTPLEDPNHILQLGDACTVNMEGFMENDGAKGDPLPNAASGDRVEVVLGQGRYMEGLVEGLIGSKVGDTVEVSVTFPINLRDKTLAGKAALFDVTILEASKRTVPEITDEFAEKVRAGLTKDTLLEELKKAIDQEDAKEYTPARNKVLAEALADCLEVDVPDTLVTNQAREKYAVMMAEMRDNGVDDEEIQRQINPENFLKYKKIVEEDICKDFKVSMAADEIARIENIEVPEYQIEEQMASIRKDAAENNEEFDETLIRQKVENTMSRQAVFDWLADQSDLKVHYTEEEQFDQELMEKLAQESLERETAMQADNAASSSTEVVDAQVVEPTEADASTDVQDGSAESEEEKKKRYANMDVGDRAFEILKDIGAVGDDSK